MDDRTRLQERDSGLVKFLMNRGLVTVARSGELLGPQDRPAWEDIYFRERELLHGIRKYFEGKFDQDGNRFWEE
jgi:hypothetical protein